LDLKDAEVRREWENIDILVTSRSDRLVIVIENKVDSAEHSDQLARYLNTARARYKDYRIVPIFLTRDGSEPSHPEYHVLSYPKVSQVLKSVTERGMSMMPSDVEVAIRHYIDAVERHMNPESEIALLAQKIYERHRSALDIIFEYRPDETDQIRLAITDSIERTSGLNLVSSAKSTIQFIPESWEAIPSLQLGDSSWAGHPSLIRFEVKPNSGLVLALHLGPARSEVRDIAYELLHSDEFQKNFPQLGQKYNRWNQLWREFVYRKVDEDDLTTDQKIERWKRVWARFLENDYPELEKVVLKLARMEQLMGLTESNL
jgi:hypothetical protein